MRGIFRYEKRNLSMILFLFLICIITILQNTFRLYPAEMIRFDNLDIQGNVFLLSLQENFFSVIMISTVFIGIMTAIQYKETNVGKAGEFLSVLPIKKNHLFAIRTGIGILFYTIPWALFSAGALILRIKYEGQYQQHVASFQYAGELLANDSVKSLIIYLICLWCAITMIYGVFIFMQNICRNSWISSLIGFGTIFFPYIVFYCLEHMNVITENSWITSILLYGTPTDVLYVWDEGIQENIEFIYFSHVYIVMFAQLFIAALFLGVAYRLYIKQDLSRKQNFMYYSWMGQAVRFGISFSVVLYICSINIQLEQKIGKLPSMMMIAIITAIVYKVTEWMQGNRERRRKNV